MRPFTVSSHRNLLKLGVTLFTDATTDLPQWQMEEQILAFAWERTVPIEDVVRAIDDGSAWQKILAWGDAIEFDQLGEFVAEINKVAERLRAKVVEVVPRPGTGDEPGAPGN